MKNAHFDQYEFEFAISKQLSFGTEAEIAQAVGVSPGIMSQTNQLCESFEAPKGPPVKISTNRPDGRLDAGQCGIYDSPANTPPRIFNEYGLQLGNRRQ